MSKILNISFIDILPITDRVSTNQHVVDLRDNITFTETEIDNGQSYRPFIFNDKLNFHENFATSGAKRSISLSDTIHFTDKVHRVFEESLSDTLIFTQNLYRPYVFINDITFTEIFIVDYGSFISDNIKFTETFLVNHLWHDIRLSDTIVFSENGFEYIVPGPVTTYIQPAGTIIDPGTNLPTTAPTPYKSKADPWSIINTPILTINRQDYITLTDAANNILTLRNPSFGNQYKYNYNRIQRETRGRDLLINANSTYAFKSYVEVLAYTIDYLKQIDGANLINFLNLNLGMLITLIDYEGMTFKGIIITPEVQLIQKDRANYSTTFELEIVPF
jgi:hypothetical protein